MPRRNPHQADNGRFRGSERTGVDEAVACLGRETPYHGHAAALATG